MLNILIIEDDPSFAEILASFLERSGHRPELAANGKEGIEKFSQKRFDAVFTDIRMPLVDGNQVARHILEAGSGDTLVIGMSGTIDLANHALFNAMLEKPFNLSSISDVLEHHRDRLRPAGPCKAARHRFTAGRPAAASPRRPFARLCGIPC
jgi:CheY-like chemotaxis protein